MFSFRPSWLRISARCCADENGAIVVTGSPGRSEVRIDVKNVTTINTTMSWITRRTTVRTYRLLPRSYRSHSFSSTLASAAPDCRNRVSGGQAGEGRSPVGQRRPEDAVHGGLERDRPQRVLEP